MEILKIKSIKKQPIEQLNVLASYLPYDRVIQKIYHKKNTPKQIILTDHAKRQLELPISTH